MKKEDYIYTVLSRVTDNNAKQQIKSELEGHLDDRIKYYEDAGYDKATAVEKAISHMGMPDDTGRQLNELHKSKFYIPVTIVIVILYAVISFFMCITSILLYSDQIEFEPFWLAFEAIILILNFTSLFFAKRYSSEILYAIPTAFFFSFFVLVLFGAYTSHTVTVLCSMVVGKFSDFVNLIVNYEFNLTDNRVRIISTIVFAVLTAFSALVSYNIIRFKSNKYSITDAKIYNILDKAIAVLLVITLVFSGITAFFINKETRIRYADEESISADGIYIIESDKKINPSEIELTEDDYILIDYDWGLDYAEPRSESERFVETDYVLNRVKYNEYASYNTYTITSIYDASKKYVMVIPVIHNYDSSKDQPVFDDAVWYETDSDKELQIKGNIYENIYYQVDIV